MPNFILTIKKNTNLFRMGRLLSILTTSQKYLLNLKIKRLKKTKNSIRSDKNKITNSYPTRNTTNEFIGS